MDRSVIVTKDLAIKTVLLGACRIPQVGKSIKEFSFDDLIWADTKKELKEKKSLPLWTLGSYGYGSGYGYGYGYGSGDGSGYGSGSGDGDGSGDGSGYGLINKVLNL